MRFCSLLGIALATVALGQVNPVEQETYTMPPQEIADFINLPRESNLSLGTLNPGATHFMALKSAGLPSLADLSIPYENLGGLMIDYKANRARSYSLRGASQIVIRGRDGAIQKEVAAPANSRFSNPSWTADGKDIVVLVHHAASTQIYILNAESGQLRRLTSRPLLLTLAAPVVAGSGKSLVAVLVPEKRPGLAVRAQVPAQPRVFVGDPAKNNLRTFRGLLKNREDQDRLEYLTTGQLVRIDIGSGRIENIGSPMMIESIDPSPNADYVRITTVQKPFSYIVPFSTFGRREEIWDQTGKALAVLSDRKMRTVPDALPAGTTPTTTAVDSKRNLTWAPDGNGLTYITADIPATTPDSNPASPKPPQEQGRRQGTPGGTTQGARKEKLVRWVAPFGKENVQTLWQSDTGFGTVLFTDSMKGIVYTESVSGTQSAYLAQLDKAAEKKTLYVWKQSETAKNPGSFVTTDNTLGVPTVRMHDGKLFLQGTLTKDDENFETPQPWLDRLDSSTGKTERLWQSPIDAYETLSNMLSSDGSQLVIERQSETETPNQWLFENGKRSKQLTNRVDLHPDLTKAQRYRFQVTRADGFKFWVKVTAPRWHVPGAKLPAFFWFYPSELEDQAAYDRTQRSKNKNLFPAVSINSKAVMVRRGWAVVEPDCPIVGPRNRVNDFYVNHLRMNLSATIDRLEKEQIIDRTKLGIGGHSYGGFSTANAMIHTPFFKAGIAGAGNFNRTLTPMAFQGEQRSLFEAKDTYLGMSPILFAENLNGALLMYCGMDDQNVGTDPINSERMFNVLESIGKTTSLYMYPYEDHGQIARETVLDMWARHIAWLDKYVLGEPVSSTEKPKATPPGQR